MLCPVWMLNLKGDGRRGRGGVNELIQAEVQKEILLFSCGVESPATVKDLAVLWLSPEAAPNPPTTPEPLTPPVAPGTSGQAVIR